LTAFKIVVGGQAGTTDEGNLLPMFCRAPPVLPRSSTRISDVRLIQNFHRLWPLRPAVVIDVLRARLTTHYPYFRGLISEIGFEPPSQIPYDPAAPGIRGITKNNFFTRCTTLRSWASPEALAWRRCGSPRWRGFRDVRA
jgi:hypothetical protein